MPRTEPSPADPRRREVQAVSPRRPEEGIFVQRLNQVLE